MASEPIGAPLEEQRAPAARWQLRGGWRVAARAAWLATALLALAVFVATLPDAYAKYVAVCTGPACDASDLTPEGARQIAALGLSVGFVAAAFVALECLFVAVSFAVAGLIFWRRSDDGAALLIGLFVAVFSASLFLGGIRPPPPWHLPVDAIRLLGAASLFLFVLLFPDGRFVPGWSRFAALALGLLGLAAALVPALAWLRPFEGANALVLLGLGIGAQIYRYRAASGPAAREQTRWVVLGVGLAIAVLSAAQVLAALGATRGILAGLASALAVYLALLLVPLSIGLAILRYRLWGISILLNRTLVYALLTACVIAIYVLEIGALGALFQASGNLLIATAATGLVAVLFQPLRERLQRGVNRLIYGERDDPYVVLGRLGAALEAAVAPEELLPAIVESLARALKLPYAAIMLDQAGRSVVAASVGALAPGTLRLPLIYGGETIGQLVVAPRAPGEGFGAADTRLLGSLAQQLAAATSAARMAAERQRLAEDLQRSRERLVLAREEERRRLRRDLHDDLGPTLAGLALSAGAVADTIGADPATAAALANELQEHIRATVGEVRRLVYALRPPALDELGLVGAIREQAERYSHGGGPAIAIEAPAEALALPAAVEVAAYRIVAEALANVLRHAHARACTVRLAADAGALLVEVADDGVGIGAARAGVGMLSMRERAAELGGTCLIEPAAQGGTRVQARLPIAAL